MGRISIGTTKETYTMMNQERYDKRFYVKTTDRQLNEVKKMSEELRCSVSYIVREFIDDGLMAYRNMKLLGKIK